MTTAEARQLVQKTFQNPFDKGQFIYFIKNLVNEINEEKVFHARGYVHEKYRDRVKTYERIGTYTDPENNKIDILIVYLQKENSIDHARTTLRNFVGDYLKERGEKEAGLIAFVSPNQKDWRFSLVKMEYKITETPSGRIKAKEEFTPAKRYSFLVGVEETSHTAQSRLVPILEDDANNPALKQLEEAFNIEKVTKEFFEKYRELYLWVKETLDEVLKKDKALKADFAGKNIDTVDFCKKLLGQIVFLYFLQKKGWFGVKRGEAWGSGSKNFLRELFDKKHGDYKNFFNDILEPLFYEALRNDRSHDDHYFSMFKCKIPFLNGGLFDPINNYDWKETDIILPNDLFSNSYKTKEGDIGTGILDIFDRYNFTVKEDEPLEKEVAVDPEMLGKVFENLLEVKDRKSKGTYYTPREIVHYMCQESLVNYLATELDKKVSKKDVETLIKYGETVVEHEAEVESRGRETKTYSHKLPKTVRDNAKLIDEKLETIRICDPAVGSGAFPVGMMNEIIRTRNVLTSYLKTKKGRTIYDFKRHAIQNCLYGVDIDLGAVEIAKLRLWLSLIVDEEDIKQIKPLPNLDYKIVQGNSLLGIEKEKMGVRNMFYELLTNELKDKKQLYFNETSAKKKQEYKNKIDELIRQITNNNKNFDFEVYFSEVFHEKKGFDVMIANPPYINANDMKRDAELYRQLYSTPFGSYDIYILFFEKSIAILKDKGVLTFITSNKYLIADYAKKLRRFIVENTRILTLLDLADCKKVFEHAFVSPAITILQKEKAKNYKVELGLLKDRDIYNLNEIKLSLLNTTDLVQGTNNVFDIYSLDENKSILTKLNDGSTPLDQVADVRTGVMGFEYWKMEPFIKEGRQVGHIRIITNGQIDRYAFIFNQKINLYKKIFYNPYLDVKNAPINENTKQLFSSQKIIIRGVAKELSAQFDDSGFGVLVAVHTAIPKKPEYSSFYLLALINSSLFNWYHLTKFYTARIPMGSLKYPISFLKQLPIKSIDPQKQKPFTDLVDEILAITKGNDYLENSGKQAKVRDYEKQIDQLVYKLYGLTPEEIKIVENHG